MEKQIIIETAKRIFEMEYGFHLFLVGLIILVLLILGLVEKLLRLNKEYREWADKRREERKKLKDKEKKDKKEKELEEKEKKKSENEKSKDKKEKEDYSILTDGEVLLTLSFAVIIFTICFLGAIEQRYSLPDLRTEIDSSMRMVGDNVGEAFSFLFKNIYNLGKKNPKKFFWVYWLVILVFVYELLFRRKIYYLKELLKGGLKKKNDKFDNTWINRGDYSNRSYWD